MKLYTFTVTLVDRSLPYRSRDEAEKDAREWAKEIAIFELCEVVEVIVEEEEEWEDA